jgi:hypothetical protein
VDVFPLEPVVMVESLGIDESGTAFLRAPPVMTQRLPFRLMASGLRLNRIAMVAAPS